MRRPLAARGLGAAPEYLRPCCFQQGEIDAESERRGADSSADVTAPHEQLQSLPQAGEGLLAALRATGVQHFPSRWMGFVTIFELVLPARGLGWRWSVQGDDPNAGTNSSRA